MTGNDLRLFDAHCHLQDERLEPDLQAVLARARESSLCHLACNGCWQADWDRVLQLSQEHPFIIPNLGLHPWWIERRSSNWLPELRQKLLDNPRAGLGECGLDKGLKAPKVELAAQLDIFKQQLQLAQELRRPVSIHCVRAFGSVHEALQELKIDVPVVLHSYTGSKEMVTTLGQLPRIYFSLSGSITKVPPEKALSMVRSIPHDRLLLESDSPDGIPSLRDAWLDLLPAAEGLLPELMRYDKRNEPSVIRTILKLIALILELPEEQVAAMTCRNAEQVFLGSAGCCD